MATELRLFWWSKHLKRSRSGSTVTQTRFLKRPAPFPPPAGQLRQEHPAGRELGTACLDLNSVNSFSKFSAGKHPILNRPNILLPVAASPLEKMDRSYCAGL